MADRILHLESPVYLSLKYNQLCFKYPQDCDKKDRTVPIQDVAVLVLDNDRITLSQPLIAKCAELGVVIVGCDEKHLPVSLTLSLNGNSNQSQIFQAQAQISEPLKKQLWKQIVIQKINNQAALLKTIGGNAEFLKELAQKVNSGDTNNCEAVAAAYYWKNIFKEYVPAFTRDRYGEPPNSLLNYGYAILRAMTARAIVAAGLHPTLGIFHHGKYNAYCLADDLMEPFRPWVDRAVYELLEAAGTEILETGRITRDMKTRLYEVLFEDTVVAGVRHPVCLCLGKTAVSFVKTFRAEPNEPTPRKLVLPKF